jgi:hypothetical protein
MTSCHDHSHAYSAYYLEQLCTIGVCGTLGLVAVMLYYQRFLNFMLAPFLHPYVLGSGWVLIGLAGFRTVLMWSSRGHHHHGHDHSWGPWRYGVLCLPIMLYFLGLPNQGFSSAKAVEVEDIDHPVVDQGGDVIHLDFLDLERWAYDETQRNWSEGRNGELKGQFAPGKSSEVFGLVRFKIISCICDAIRLDVAILSPNGIGKIKPGAWVQVTGQIQYRKRKGRDEYVPVLKVRSPNDIVPVPPENPPYLQ